MLSNTLTALLSLSAMASAKHSNQARTTAATAACPGADGQTFTDADGYTYQINCNSDYSVGSNDIIYEQAADFGSCIKSCSDYNLGYPVTQCSAVVFRGTDCFFKFGSVTIQASDAAAALVVSPPASMPAVKKTTALTCPGDLNKHYIDPNDGTEYDVLCGFDSNANNIANFEADTFQICVSACSQRNEGLGNSTDAACNGVSYDVDNKWCYFKDGFSHLTQRTDWNAALVTKAGTSAMCPIKPTHDYTTPEGDLYGVNLIATHTTGAVLLSTNSTNACDCAEDCSRYNRNVKAGKPLCKGAEFNLVNSGASCLVKS